jgi:hypothetical protein
VWDGSCNREQYRRQRRGEERLPTKRTLRLPERDGHDHHEQERYEDDWEPVPPAPPPRQRLDRRPAEHGGADGRQRHSPPRVVIVELPIARDQIEELVQRGGIECQDHGGQGQHGEEGGGKPLPSQRQRQ